jgi:hypothetical protein
MKAAAPGLSASARSVSLRRPDDWHVHLRDHEMLKAVLPYTAAQFGRGSIMPNLAPPAIGEGAPFMRWGLSYSFTTPTKGSSRKAWATSVP